MNRRKALIFAGFAAILAGCGGPPPPSAPSALLAKPIPDIHRRAVGGADVDTARARGKVVIVKFFAKYCEPCRRTLPEMEALHREAPEVLVVGVAVDENESDVREMIETYRLTFDVVHDRGNVLSGRYRVRELPVTFVADTAGEIRWVGGAEAGKDGLERVIAAAKAPAPPKPTGP